MNQVTILMPVSRDDFLERIFHDLETLECKRETTNLLVVVDGDAELFVKTRNYVEMSKFSQRLCIQYKNQNKFRNYDLKARRLRISDIHNTAKKHILECDYVFGIEDDTLFPSDTLKKLLNHYFMYPHTGFIQGVEMGRWGIPYVGAWKADDVYDPNSIHSLMPTDKVVTEIDAGGFYCYLTTRDNYMMHHYKPFGNNDLGPDMDFGISLRQQGLMNYADWSIKCVHKDKEKDITFVNTQPRVVTMIKKDNAWRQSNTLQTL